MWSIHEPSPDTMRAILLGQAPRSHTYDAVGATANVPPAGYVVDHNRILLGHGPQVFAAAKAALAEWAQFNLGWVEAFPADSPIAAGQTVAIKARVCGLWALNVCRIVYVVDEPGPERRFGFAYGTLPEHAERGEERFLIEWNAADDAVWYDILAFSRPNQLLARLAYPVVRRLQKRFARDSLAAMRRRVVALTAGC